MSTIQKAFFTLALAFLIASCGNQSEANHDHAESEAAHEHSEAESHDDIGVSLDKGKRWSANPETTDGIANMIKIMNGFSDRESVVAYAELNMNLQNEFALIFEKCTMTGEAHNQLHNYLIPIKDMFAGLISSDVNTCKSTYDKMAKQLAEYSNYFV